MKKVKQFLKALGRLSYLKYVVVVVIGVAVVAFLDENSIWAHLRYKQRISELKEEIAGYEAVNQRNQAQIRQLQHTPKAMEKIARERYFMKADDEDIFVLSDDEQQPQPVKAPANETVE